MKVLFEGLERATADLLHTFADRGLAQLVYSFGQVRVGALKIDD